MSRPHPLRLASERRRALWRELGQRIDAYLDQVHERPVQSAPPVSDLRRALAAYDFATPVGLDALIDFVDGGLRQQVHTGHPRYFGLFNPAPTTLGIAADALVAAYNPQLAAWSHAPFANEVERHLVLALARRFGYAPDAADGTICSGGAEANHTALIAALTHCFTAFATGGVRALDGAPVIYVSSQSHHSFVKAARFCGLGTDAIHEVTIDDDLKLDPHDLRRRIGADRAAGRAPCLIVATGGSTNAGVVDPLPSLADVAREEGLWLHLDAAWGGGAVLVDELRGVLAGCERADSITFDAHKWLSVPMGAGMFLTRHRDILARACAVDTDYMPDDAARLAVRDPFTHSMQWSRRFAGLKIFMSLAAVGFDGYAEVLRQQTAAGERLRELLTADGWRLENDTPLPVVCFSHPRIDRTHYGAIARRLGESGQAWISVTRLREGAPVLRACITNFLTGERDVQALADALRPLAQRYGR